jgi:hypothetical protein
MTTRPRHFTICSAQICLTGDEKPQVSEPPAIQAARPVTSQDRPGYAEGWDWKRAWYARNGFELNKNLFTTSELGALDMRDVERAAEKVRDALS